MTDGAPAGLLELAARAGIATSFVDLRGHTCDASTATLQALLAALGLPAGDEGEVVASTRRHRRERWAGLVEPTTVCWLGDEPAIGLRRPEASAATPVEVTVELEGGGSLRRVVTDEHLAETGRTEVEGVAYVAHRARLGERLPTGAHRVRVVAGDRSGTAHLLVAPRQAPAPGRGWGVFAPLHALRRSGHDRVGDLDDLGMLADWAAELGASLVGTLPLLATFDGDPSPYAPVSRVAWNERHLHLSALPEWAGDDPPGVFDGELVDPVAEAARSRAALETATARLGDARRAELDRFTRAHPHVDELARWRAAVDERGPIAPGQPVHGGDPAAVLRHRYGQWAMEEQLGALADRLDRRGQSLYLDLPLGVHGRGFDVWRAPELFARGVSVGAPPDSFFTGGQDWGFPPVLPEASRAVGHAHLRAGLAHQVRHARFVRMDHVMALHRLWWVPEGAPATDGAYVHYPAEELAAAVTLEACRAGAVVVGENLGTVPPEVGRLLTEHRLIAMFATQFELESAPHVHHPPEGALAVVNTHDMEPFAAFWNRADAGFRGRIVEQLDRDGHPARGEDVLDVLEALLGWLGASDASTVVVTLEDLWAEIRPQNRPGTGPEEANWRRRMTRTLEDVRDDEALAGRLDRLRAARPAVTA